MCVIGSADFFFSLLGVIETHPHLNNVFKSFFSFSYESFEALISVNLDNE